MLELLKKYDVPGPRYTSYPTVPAWTESVGADAYVQSLGQLQKGENLSLYFHLPFCENLCHFCGCMQVITKDHSRSRGYVDTLIKEIKKVATLIKDDAKSVSQIHFGGGTPNFLQPSELTDIMTCVRDHFDVQNDAEIAIEMHPRTSTDAFCNNLPQNGFNRISLGVQDFDDRVQKLINRHQTYDMTEKMVTRLRDLGFDSFNFDLVYGLPGQTVDTWHDTLERVKMLSPNRLAVYSYAHVPWVRPVQRTFKDSDLPTPETKLKLFEMAYEHFSKGGYQLIGMDHFARADDELARALHDGSIHRNFMGYSTRADTHQLGFGVSAISYVAGNYFQNAKELKKYLAIVEEGGLASFRGCLLSPDDHIRRDLILQIMCQTRFDVSEFEHRHKIDFKKYFGDVDAALREFVADKLLSWNGKQFKVTGYGFLFLRNMAMLFDPYLIDIKTNSKTPVFSRTV